MVGLGFMTMGILKVAIGNTDGNLIDFCSIWYFNKDLEQNGI